MFTVLIWLMEGILFLGYHAPFPVNVNDVKPLQPEKAYKPIVVTELGMVTEVKPVQYPKALSPIDVTELPMVTEVKPEQPQKALSPIVVTEPGIMVFLQPLIKVLVAVSIIALQLLRESYFVFPLSTTIEVKPLQ